MSLLVKWPLASATERGLYPAGYSRANFDGPPDDEAEPGYLVGRLIAEAIPNGFDAFEYPPVPTIEVTDISGDGLVFFDPAQPTFAIARKGSPVHIIATNSGPAGTWSTPIQSPMAIKYATTAKAEGSDTMEVTVTFDEAGDWELTEALINQSPDRRFAFAGLKIRVVLS